MVRKIAALSLCYAGNSYPYYDFSCMVKLPVKEKALKCLDVLQEDYTARLVRLLEKRLNF